MTEARKYKKALKFAKKKHKGQFRIGGDAYITHPMAVADIVRQGGYGVDVQITALFHDLLEDTDTTEADILAYGNEQILAAVRLLTKQKGYDMSTYIEGIRKSEMAMAVKAADRLHNLHSATMADEAFRRRYIAESVEWYWDFSPEIPGAIKALAESLKAPMTEYPFLYESGELPKKRK